MEKATHVLHPPYTTYTDTHTHTHTHTQTHTPSNRVPEMVHKCDLQQLMTISMGTGDLVGM